MADVELDELDIGRDVNVFFVEGDVYMFRKGKAHHKLQNLEDAITTARSKLSTEKTKVQAVLGNLEKAVSEIDKDQKEFQRKKAVVKSEILQRFSKIVAEAEKYRDDALAALESSSSEVERTIRNKLDDAKGHRDNVRSLCQKLEQAERKGAGCELIKLDSEMGSGNASQTAVKMLTEVAPMTTVRRPVHRGALPLDDVMFRDMQNFIGTCEVVTLQCPDEEEEELTIRREIRCGDHDDVTVYCVKAKQNGAVDVSFDPWYRDQMPLALVCGGDGGSVTTLRGRQSHTQFGRISFVERNFCLTFLKTDLFKSLFAKSVASCACTWILNHSNNACVVLMDTLVSAKPLLTTQEELFSIPSGSCRAMDVDTSQTYFVVVEDAERQRKVLLYKRPDTNVTVTSVDSYIPPITPFQPADVCFYTLLGQQVLLIADEANDVIHVAEVKDDRLTFTRFLSPGCPLLLQPTALNTDHKGRLWVGCRGGRLVTFQGLSAAVRAAIAADDEPCSGDGELCSGDGEPCSGDGELCSGDGEPCSGDGELCSGDGELCSDDGDVFSVLW